MSKLDYSKWDHIEISDDEDETHPNIDTPSLFRWRHQARVERMEEQKREREQLEKGKQAHKQKLKEVEQKLKSQALSEADAKKMSMTKEELKKQEEEFQKKERELLKKEKEQPWNVDTICKEGFSKSVINKKADDDKNKTEEELFEEQKLFQEKNQKQLQHYGMLSKAADSRKYLQENPHLVSEKAANYLVIWCIDLQVDEKTSLMEQVAHQTIVLQFILQLASKMDTDPRNCFNAFFNRFEMSNADYMESFHDELNSFKKRVKERAEIRIQEAIKKYEEEERQKELGPGGLHPGEVMETLPAVLRECFEKQDIPMLQKAISEMDQEDAKYHIKRCVDSGLWVPNANAKDDGAEEEEVYEEVEGSSAPDASSSASEANTSSPEAKDAGTEV
ncbi:hsp90 co-chaperone Cdc37 [Ciona intestinalis]